MTPKQHAARVNQAIANLKIISRIARRLRTEAGQTTVHGAALREARRLFNQGIRS